MRDLTLWSPDDATMQAALDAAGLWRAADPILNTPAGPITASDTHALYYPGVLYAQDGTTVDGNGVTIPNMQPIEGVWAFLRCKGNQYAKKLTAVIVDPMDSVVTCWAGSKGRTMDRYDKPAKDFVKCADKADEKARRKALRLRNGKTLAKASDDIDDGDTIEAAP